MSLMVCSCIICGALTAPEVVCDKKLCYATAREQGWRNAAQVLKRQRDEILAKIKQLETIRTIAMQAFRSEYLRTTGAYRNYAEFHFIEWLRTEHPTFANALEKETET